MPDVLIRPVELADIEAFYDHQADPVASEMAAFPTRERDQFVEHWTTRVLVNEGNYARAIVADGQVAGNVLSWIDPENGQRMFGYWLGREFWGKGIATDAVRLALAEITDRPIHADVAVHNVGSRRVLEKNGFKRLSDEPTIADDGVGLFFYRLD
jgi:RimJ/RimL family protein N-acetyltransferase